MDFKILSIYLFEKYFNTETVFLKKNYIIP